VSEGDLALVARLYAAFNAGDREAMLEFAHPELELVAAEQSPLAGTYRGTEGVLEFFRRLFEVWDEGELRREPEELRMVGDRVLAVLRVHARFSATGIELDEHWADLWTVRDGKVMRVQVFTDPAEALRAAEASDE
jgi:ketosteroid isomerase-like protein